MVDRWGKQPASEFQSTLSLRRATISVSPVSDPAALISIHALLAESDAVHHIPIPEIPDFNPRSPCGERPPRGSGWRHAPPRFQSTLSLRRATALISLVSLLAPISIHALLAESDLWTRAKHAVAKIFQSTLSLRRATPRSPLPGPHSPHFNPRSPCGERPMNGLWRCSKCHFNPRSPCGERRLYALFALVTAYFNPRSPCGERLRSPRPQLVDGVISIHALLAESDLLLICQLNCNIRFQSTLSLRRATWLAALRFVLLEFQSTLSLRRATQTELADALSTTISIHALLAESDPDFHGPGRCPAQFQSTLSLRRATFTRSAISPYFSFQSTLSLRRATTIRDGFHLEDIFQSTLSLRRATPGNPASLSR